MNDNKLSLKGFIDVVAARILNYMPDSFKSASVEVKMVRKNNDLILNGLVIDRIGQKVSPTLYLEQFYEEYQESADLEGILRKIAEIRIKSDMREKFDVDQITEFSRARSRILPKLINKGLNEKLLATRPYKEIADLAITFQISLEQGFSENAVVAVTNELMDLWGTDVDTLYEISLINMKEITPSTFSSMESVLQSILGEDDESLMGELPTDESMFVLSNKANVNGSTAVLDKDMMKKIVDRIGPDFYCIPSSIHEWIVLRASEGMDESTLSNMIQSVNDEQLSIDQVLSDHPYKYTLETGLVAA